MSRNKSAKRSMSSTNECSFGRLRYFVSRAISNVRQNIFVNILTIVTIAMALLILSLFLLLFVNLEGTADDWSKRVQITAYCDQDLNPKDMKALRERAQSLPGTAHLVYVSKDEAIERFRARLKGQESLLEGVTADILPASFEITLKQESRTSEAIEAHVAALRNIPGVSDVQYGEEWVKRFNTFMNFMRMVGALLGSFLLLAVIFIVSNTIKLTIYARKEELELLGLVGATKSFIKIPFLIEGALQGAVGAVLSLVVLTGFYLAFLHNAGDFLSFNPIESGLSFLSSNYLLGIFGGGVALGFLGSLVSLKRFVNI